MDTVEIGNASNMFDTLSKSFWPVSLTSVQEYFRFVYDGLTPADQKLIDDHANRLIGVLAKEAYNDGEDGEIYRAFDGLCKINCTPNILTSIYNLCVDCVKAEKAGMVRFATDCLPRHVGLDN